MEEAQETKDAKAACVTALQRQSGLTVKAEGGVDDQQAAISSDGWPAECSAHCAKWQENLLEYASLAGCKNDEVGISHLNCGLVIYQLEDPVEDE